MGKKSYAVISILAVGLIVGFLLGRFPIPKQDTEIAEEDKEDNARPVVVEDTLNTTARPLPEPVLAAQGDVVHVKDQQEGSQVFLSRLELTRSGWAAVREINDGVLGNILGAKRFDAGVHQGIIPILRNTEAGKHYVVILYTDDGDKIFDFEKDAVIVDTEGNLVLMQFEVY